MRSGYKLARTYCGEQVSDSNDDLRKWWTTLWKAKIPSKCKLFIWKAYHECLPTTYCLRKRGIDISLMCIVCKSKMETIDHVLCGCKRSKQICDSVFPRVDAKIQVANNFAD